MHRKKKKKPIIAMICVSLRGGGTERVLTRIANHLINQFDVRIFTLVDVNPFYPLDDRIQVYSPDLQKLKKQKISRKLNQLVHLYKSLKANRPDVTMIFGEDIAAVACLISWLARVRKQVVLFRGTPERSLQGWNGLLNPLVCRLADRIVVQTTASREQLSGHYTNQTLVTIPNPIEIPKNVLTYSERKKVILSVGSLGRKKNQAALIRAFAGLERRNGWMLTFIGDGPDRELLEKLARRLGVGEQTEFLGESNNVEGILSESRIFAFTSLSEGFPNALGEALAAGCACISYDCPTGPSDLIDHGVNGLLIPNDDAEHFRKSLQYLINNPELQASFSSAARKNIRCFDAEVVLSDFEKMIEKVLKIKNIE